VRAILVDLVTPHWPSPNPLPQAGEGAHAQLRSYSGKTVDVPMHHVKELLALYLERNKNASL
jgi:hypothetical protein